MSYKENLRNSKNPKSKSSGEFYSTSLVVSIISREKEKEFKTIVLNSFSLNSKFLSNL